MLFIHMTTLSLIYYLVALIIWIFLAFHILNDESERLLTFSNSLVESSADDLTGTSGMRIRLYTGGN